MLSEITYRSSAAASALGWAFGGAVVGVGATALVIADLAIIISDTWRNKPMTVRDYHFHQESTQQSIVGMTAAGWVSALHCFHRAQASLSAVRFGPPPPPKPLSFYQRVKRIVGLV